MKAKKKTKRTKRKATVTYTHRDGSGMLWHFVGGRPRSALADKVMAECGLDPNK